HSPFRTRIPSRTCDRPSPPVASILKRSLITALDIEDPPSFARRRRECASRPWRQAGVRHSSDRTPDAPSQQRRFQPLFALFPVRHHLLQESIEPCAVVAVSSVTKLVNHYVF